MTVLRTISSRRFCSGARTRSFLDAIPLSGSVPRERSISDSSGRRAPASRPNTGLEPAARNNRKSAAAQAAR